MKKILTIKGMDCMNCVKQIYNVLTEIPEVTSVSIDLRTETVFLESKKKIDDSKIKDVVDQIGYEVEDIENVC